MNAYFLRFIAIGWGLFLISCFPESSRTFNASDVSAIDDEVFAFVNDHSEALHKVVGAIKEKFPPSEYNYIFVGQSPTPFLALMDGLKNVFSIPISELKSDSIIQIVPTKNCLKIHVLKKIFDHFDIYLGAFLSDISQKKLPPNIVVIDYVSSGRSLGLFLKLINMYMRYKYNEIAPFKKWVDSESRFPQTAYFVVGYTDFNLGVNIEKNIQDQNKNFAATTEQSINMLIVDPGEIWGSRVVAINLQKLADQFNFLNQTQKWPGFILHLAQDEYFDLNRLLFKGAFDRYSPYGLWPPYSAILEKEKPKISKRFLEFKSLLQKKSGFLCCLRPKVAY